jgi:hypothetical protein
MGFGGGFVSPSLSLQQSYRVKQKVPRSAPDPARRIFRDGEQQRSCFAALRESDGSPSLESGIEAAATPDQSIPEKFDGA